ncbi:HDOD domain-containing protein [Methylomonas sp. AM2-LC]|uniref:HDOD domain-containing protein n=1 Tax=Methylomonas sp. AM2-LC TaxID=3153301 RepID=UPI003265A758
MSQIYPADSLPINFLEKYKDQIRITPLKMNIQRLLEALADNDMTPKQMSDVIYHYPVISARLICLANSAWASPLIPVTSVEAACIRLGNALIKSVSIAIAVSSSFNTARCPAFKPIRHWATSLLVAETAVLLFNHIPDKTPYPLDIEPILRSSGILHNIGLLWLADNFALETDQVLNHTSTHLSVCVNQTFQQSLGVDYCAIGAWIARHMEIPEVLTSVIAQHRNPEVSVNTPLQILLVGSAAKMVSALFHQTDWVADSVLLDLGIANDQQLYITEQLEKRFVSTKELARVLLAN